MQDLVINLNNTLRLLRQAIDKRYEVASKRCEAEYKYRTALGEAMAQAKAAGMAATALYDYCRGIEQIAALRDRRDLLVAQEEYLTELIFYHRTAIRVYEGQIGAERKGL